MKIIINKQEIIKALNLPENCEIEMAGETSAKLSASKSKTLTVNFPSKTAKEIYKETDNKIGNGKLLWDIGWYENEDFFTKEKTRKEERTIDLEILHKGKSWNEINDLKGENEMLNFAEVVYLLTYHPEFGEILKGYNWTWTSSRASDGQLVYVGSFDERGAAVRSIAPDYRYAPVGVSFCRS